MIVLLVLFGTYRLCLAAALHLRIYAPTNIALDYLRSRRGLKWAVPASLVSTPLYWGAGYTVTTVIENGGPGWLNPLAALCAWNGLKFAMLGLWTSLLLSMKLITLRGRPHTPRVRSRPSPILGFGRPMSERCRRP